MKLGSLLLEVLVVLPSPSQQLLDCFFNIIDLNFTPKVTQLGIGRTKFLFFSFLFKKKKGKMKKGMSTRIQGKCLQLQHERTKDLIGTWKKTNLPKFVTECSQINQTIATFWIIVDTTLPRTCGIPKYVLNLHKTKCITEIENFGNTDKISSGRHLKHHQPRKKKKKGLKKRLID